MEQLKSKDIDQVFNLIQHFPSNIETSAEINRFLLETQRVFDSDELVFLYPNPHTQGIDLKRSFNLQRGPDFLSSYADYFWRYDPLYSAELSSEHTVRAFRTQDVMPYGNFVKLKYYYDFLKPQGLFSELVIRLYFKSYFLGAISLLRSRERPLFDENDVQKAELLVPYIVDKIDTGDVFSKNIQEQKLFEQWLESQSEGIVLLDFSFHTLYFNSEAEEFCGLMNGRSASPFCDLESTNIAVPEVIIQDCRLLSDSHNNSRRVSGYDNRIVNLGNQKRYHIQYFTFLPPSSPEASPNFIVVINNLSRFGAETEEIILGQAKLSHREAIVARYAGMGWTNKEIAESLYSSPFTIQNQLKKVFEKTGLKNRTQLANLMKYSDILHKLK